MEVAEGYRQQTQLGPVSSFLLPFLLGLLLIFHLTQRRGQSNNDKQLRKGRLNLIPGPRQHFLGNWLNLWELWEYRNVLEIGLKWAAETQGPLMAVHVGPFKGFVLLTPEAIQKVWGSGDIRHAEKSFLYSLLKVVPWFDGVISSKGGKWKSRRKLIVSKLSYGNLISYIQPMNDCSRMLVKGLEERFHQSGGPNQVEDLLFDSTFHTLCRTLFGIENDEEYRSYDCDGFIRHTQRFFEIIVHRTSHPWLTSDLLFRLHPMSKEVSAYHTTSRTLVEQMARDIGGAERDGIFRKPSLMKHLLQAGLSLDAIYEEVVTTFVGGYETTGNALHYLLFLLALHPTHQEICREEVDKLFDNDALCPNGDITQAGLQQALSYLEQCVLETMRLLPPPVVFTRDLGAPVTLADGIKLPPRTTLAVVPLTIHMNPQYYPSPEIFDPNRFSAKERLKRSPYAYLPFSAGPRGCLGSKFAMNEILITAARLLRHFEVKTPDRLEDVVFLPNITMRPETPMKFLFKQRRLSNSSNNNNL